MISARFRILGLAVCFWGCVARPMSALKDETFFLFSQCCWFTERVCSFSCSARSNPNPHVPAFCAEKYAVENDRRQMALRRSRAYPGRQATTRERREQERKIVAARQPAYAANRRKYSCITPRRPTPSLVRHSHQSSDAARPVIVSATRSCDNLSTLRGRVFFAVR